MSNFLMIKCNCGYMVRPTQHIIKEIKDRFQKLYRPPWKVVIVQRGLKWGPQPWQGMHRKAKDALKGAMKMGRNVAKNGLFSIAGIMMKNIENFSLSGTDGRSNGWGVWTMYPKLTYHTQSRPSNATGLNVTKRYFAMILISILDQEKHDLCGLKAYPQQESWTKKKGTFHIQKLKEHLEWISKIWSTYFAEVETSSSSTSWTKPSTWWDPAFLGRSPTMAGLAAKRLARSKMVRNQVDHQRKRQKKNKVTYGFGKLERLLVIELWWSFGVSSWLFPDLIILQSILSRICIIFFLYSFAFRQSKMPSTLREVYRQHLTAHFSQYT